jgi:signal peptidase I
MPTDSGRRPWLAALLSALGHGLGHVYAGRPLAGAAVYVLSLVIAIAASVAVRAGFVFGLPAVLVALGFWAGQALLAARAVRDAPATPRRWFSRPFALTAFWVAEAVLSSALTSSLRRTVVETVYMASGSMAPTVRTGDYLVVARGLPRDLRGAIVVHEAPPGSPRPDPLVKRIVAVPGDTVELRDGHLVVNGAAVERERVPGPCTHSARSGDGAWRDQQCLEFVERLGTRSYHTYCTPYLPCGDVNPQRVPEGHVWVAGDYRDHSADSRVYGPVPEQMVRGEVRYVFASWGASGMRWERLGVALH